MTDPSLIVSLSSSFTPDARGETPLVFGSSSSQERDRALLARQQQLLEKPITYVGNDAEFEAPDSWQKIVEAPEPLGSSKMRPCRHAADLGPLRAALETPLLTAEQETYLFRKMNYLKFVANAVREGLSSDIAEPAKVTRIDELLTESVTIRNRIIDANYGLALSVGSKYRIRDLNECVSIGWPGLMKAVDQFDYQHETKFSTYAYRSIKWEFNRYFERGTGKKAKFENSMQHHENFNPEDRSETEDSDVCPNLYLRQTKLVLQSIPSLRERERQIVVRRFGLDGEPPETLQQIGDRLQVTRERIRQIEKQALEKLSKAAGTTPE